MELLMEYMARGFVVMLIISMPCVLVAALVGLVIGVLQAVTQVQEQTIAAAPKILAVFLVIIIGGYGYVRLLTNLTTEGFSMAFNVISKNDSYVLPADYYKYTRPFQNEMKDKTVDKKNLKGLMEKTGRGDFFDKSKEGMNYYKAPTSTMPKPNLIETKKIMGR
ncbi:MAG: flagellar biosynthetic protein FliQ [Candidatus Gastranaerophilales bacterium]|nr:flagellar biosynthetic protein FliQ [Candidatus Gastranaerophilales bacterium]